MDHWDTCDDDDRRAVIATLRRQALDLSRCARSRERAAAYQSAVEILEREHALALALADAAE